MNVADVGSELVEELTNRPTATTIPGGSNSRADRVKPRLAEDLLVADLEPLHAVPRALEQFVLEIDGSFFASAYAVLIVEQCNSHERLDSTSRAGSASSPESCDNPGFGLIPGISWLASPLHFLGLVWSPGLEVSD